MTIFGTQKKYFCLTEVLWKIQIQTGCFTATTNFQQLLKLWFLQIFEDAVSQNKSAVFARQNSSNPNEVLVSSNLEGFSQVKYKLVYEEFLQRQNSKYQLPINVKLKQVLCNK
jgi:hypothetical protein